MQTREEGVAIVNDCPVLVVGVSHLGEYSGPVSRHALFVHWSFHSEESAESRDFVRDIGASGCTFVQLCGDGAEGLADALRLELEQRNGSLTAKWDDLSSISWDEADQVESAVETFLRLAPYARGDDNTTYSYQFVTGIDQMSLIRDAIRSSRLVRHG